MDEKTRTNLYRIGLIVVGLWAISASIAAGIFYYGRNTVRAELAAIREEKPDSELQSDLDSVSSRNTELERVNRELSAEIRSALASNIELTGIIDRASGLAESGQQLVRDTQQSIIGVTGTVEQLRDNYNRLTIFAIRSEGNYSAIIDELDQSSDMGGSDGTEAPREQ
jgi:hypothetical protein